MISRLIGLLTFFIGIYTLLIFFAPDFADKYGNASLNAKIRDIKTKSLNLGAATSSPTSLWSEVTGKATDFASGTRQLVDDTKATVNQIQSTVSEKTEQIKEATDSVQRAYEAINTAKTDIQKLSSFSGAITTQKH